MQPFVKWAGGKRQLMDKIVSYFPLAFNTYHEPFVGGGAVFFHLAPKDAFITDTNEELMNAFEVIRDYPDLIKEYLLLMEYGHSEEFYLKIRQIDVNPENEKLLTMNNSKILKAARFLYLNKACFNGLYRVNRNGKFNTASGKKKSVNLFENSNFDEISDFLNTNNIRLQVCDFEKVLENAFRGDFVYFDPPYDYEVGTTGFTAYQKSGFGTDSQLKLLEVCNKLTELEVLFMVSNHNTKFIREIYKDYNVHVVSARRVIGGKGATRDDVEEVIITNYDILDKNEIGE